MSAVVDLLNQFQHPGLISDWASHPGIVLESKQGDVTVTFPFAAGELITELDAWLTVQKTNGTSVPSFTLTQRVAPIKAGDKALIKGVKNVIVVSSAKGGVGKSTTSVNLALALHAQGANVGILDADIYGPSVPIMLGTKGKQPVTLDGKNMEPVEAHGLFSNSIGYLVPDENAMVWRGPMASKAFAQLVNETRWPDLDYLVVDMPPGTGDIALSMAQQFPITGAIVVTTPQDLALADAIKGVSMFDKVAVPVLGVVENMSYHICGQCGHHEAIFGQGGAQKMAESLDLSVLAQVPLHMSIREDIDAGSPTVTSKPDSEHAAIYRQLALRVACQLFWSGETAPEQISITTLGE
ncbi:iron-sulfur cluster carrier protein ApbC [Enterovibrio sp. ZSDZ42]|uniref:Iron-sulfur cluster carrier protein n=1 Tax=Enterovibrio gelatinilyticus TaxID=2899819 RepID=A0ABT5R3S6_9GAMM|nr:iron-sulfur cluster carrier protein ApbC [Enterovibrio sp. ZSDZ42]MDD1794911.1 iron-sulfur cluster carrier protein ApbC [Enterovibrio sp. ZSDZ42]